MRVRIFVLISGLLLGIAKHQVYSASTSDYEFSWGVLSFDPYYFYIQEELMGEFLGIDYECNTAVGQTCTIVSQTFPDVLGRIPRTDCIVTYHSSHFEDLNPSY